MASQLSVIVPHHNTEEKLRALLSSLDKQKVKFNFDVFVVCNPIEKYSCFPTVPTKFPLHWLTSGKGANRARRAGVEATSAPLLLFLDDDCFLEDEFFLQRHRDLHALNQGIGGIGGGYKLSKVHSFWGRVYQDIQAHWIFSSRRPNNYSKHLLGGNSSFKRAVFKSANFDSNLIFGGTETEWQRRLSKKGVSLRFFKDLEVTHDGAISFWEFFRKGFQQGIGGGYIYSLHGHDAKYVFHSEERNALGCRGAMARFLYDSSFKAGYNYYLRHKKFKASAVKIIFCTLVEVLKALAPNQQWRRETKRIFKLATIKILAPPKE